MKRYFFIQLLLTFSVLAFAKDISFRVNAPKSIPAGQQFRVEYIVNSDGRDFRTGEFSGFEVLMGPSTSSSMSTQIINGSVSSETTKTFTFILRASKEGDFTLPVGTVKVEGRQYSTEPTKIKVLPEGEAPAGGEAQSNAPGLGKNDLLLRLSLSKNKVYEDEALVATVKLMTLNSQVQLSDYTPPVFPGFTVQEVDLGKNKSFELEHYNGRNYYAVDLGKYILFPQRSGSIEVEPVVADLLVPVRSQRQMRSIFDDFFEGYQQVNKRVSSAKHKVTVMPLPAGKPDGFTGAVGKFTIDASVDNTKLKANEAFTYKIEIAGTGNIKFINDPEVNFPADFEVYDPQIDVASDVTSTGVRGKKIIEYTIIPRHAGQFDIAAIPFSYFDTASKKYVSTSTKAFVIDVAKGDGSSTASGNITNYDNVQKEDLKVLGSDIRYLAKIDAASLEKKPSFFWGTMSYWLIYVVVTFCFGVFFVIYRKRIKENANVAFTRTKRANKVAIKRLRKAAEYLKSHQKEPYYEEMLKAIWGYLGDKLTIETSELTREKVEESLLAKGVEKQLTDQFLRILSDCEFARYAPSQTDQMMDDLYDETVKAIGDLENSIRK